MPIPAPTRPNVLATVITYLNAAITPSVSSKVPTPRPAEFVTVRRSGGPWATRVSDQPQLTFECWAASDIDAYALAGEVSTLMVALADGANRSGVVVYDYVEFSGPAYLPDPDSEQDRVTWTCSLHTRAVPTVGSA